MFFIFVHYKRIDIKIYAVGGAVRDKLLGLTPHDRDFVVVDSSDMELKELGYHKVGKTHDVYLHPKTREEYVLALNNSLHDELLRRDLTINSIAIDQETFETLDPLGGVSDIENKVLRHNPFFKDDPIRLFRLLRFKAKLLDFKLAPETESMVQKLLQTPSLFKSTAIERVENEILKGFDSISFNNFITELNSSPLIEIICGAKVLFKNIGDNSNLAIEEKLAISLSENPESTLHSFLEVIGFSKIICSYTLNLKILINIDLKNNIKNILEALELIRWNDSTGNFESYILCLVTLGQSDRSRLLLRGRDILKRINLEQISREFSGKDVPLGIAAAKFRALTDQL